MKSIEILDEIVRRCFFVYSPDLWDDETDAALKELLNSELIQRLSDINPSEMNSEYTYVEKTIGKKGRDEKKD